MSGTPVLRTLSLHVVAVFSLCCVVFASANESRLGFVNQSSAPDNFVNYDGYVYFAADDRLNGRELWRTDGTKEGTDLFFEAYDGPLGGSPNRLAATKSYLFFTCIDRDAGGEKLWCSDGTKDGTRKVSHEVFEKGSVITDLFVQNELVLMVVEDDSFRRLVRTDGTAKGTFVIEGTGGASHAGKPDSPTRRRWEYDTAGNFVSLGAQLFFSIGLGSIFHTDASPDSAVRVPEPANGLILGAIPGYVLIATRYPDYGVELTRLPIGETKTELVKEIMPGAGSGVKEFPGIAFQDVLYFQGDDGENGGELWRSDGTERGTSMLLDMNPGKASSNLGWLTLAGDHFFFMAEDGVNGREIWVSDGTPEGTRMTRDINRGPRGCEPYRLYAIGNRLFFGALSDPMGEELWCSDGTESGTYMVRDIAPGKEHSEPYNRTALGSRLIFSANDHVHGFEPWITDGTEAGTHLLKDIGEALGPNPSGSPTRLYAAGQMIYFVVRTGAEGAELWRTDGTEAGTMLVKDIYAGPPSASPANFCADGETLYFSAETADNGIELWRTEGTPESTVMILDLVKGPDSSSPNNLILLDSGRILFAADEGANGMELWITDGTAAGTNLIMDILPGEEGSHPRQMTLLNGKVYFSANDGEHGEEIWVTDGTRNGTRILKDLIPRHKFGSQPAELIVSGDKLVFRTHPNEDGTALWQSDGTPGGTTPLSLHR